MHVNQIGMWRKELLERLPELFSKRRAREEAEAAREKDELYREIGQLKMELDWLKKKHAQLR